MSDRTDPTDDMTALEREVADLDVPEPSPLFWDHFSARVREAIDAPPLRARRWWRARWLVASAAAAAVLALSVIAVYQQRSPSDVPPTDPVAYRDAAPAGGGAADVPDADADEAWAVVRSFAAELHYDEALAAGVTPGQGAIEDAATELSVDERAELLRLIEDDMKRRGA